MDKERKPNRFKIGSGIAAAALVVAGGYLVDHGIDEAEQRNDNIIREKNNIQEDSGLTPREKVVLIDNLSDGTKEFILTEFAGASAIAAGLAAGYLAIPERKSRASQINQKDVAGS